jgi:tRNA(Ile)-lysidine synthase
MGFSRQRLLEIVSTLPKAPRWWVAYSGGLDSQVLLHALASLRSQAVIPPFQALHVNHGLQPEADAWAEQCRRFCEQQGIPLRVLPVTVTPARGESLEAVAREQRYRAFAQQMGAGDLLLTAHHQDDQAETVLLQLLRGSGLSGLAAMPACTAFGPGSHARPLLGFARTQLADYARAEGLTWVEDPSNRNCSFDRNYLRQEVIPLLTRRWPALGRTVSRTARHCGEAQRLIDGLAATDLAQLQREESRLEAAGLAALPPSRARAALRAWIRECGLPLPDAAHLDRVLTEVLTARPDRNPVVRWPGAELRRFRGRLWLSPPLPAFDPEAVLEWDGDTPLELPAGLGRLCVESGSGGIPKQTWSAGSVRVHFRAGGERCRPVGQGMTRSLKKLFQERAIPPWLRERVPLITIDGQLAAVGDVWRCQPFQAAEGEASVILRWDHRPAGLPQVEEEIPPFNT